jgi:hypothetical protein
MEHVIAVFNKNTTKLVTQAISNAQIQAKNEYLKKYVRQEKGSFRDDSNTYLIEDQYTEVKHISAHFFLSLRC